MAFASDLSELAERMATDMHQIFEGALMPSLAPLRHADGPRACPLRKWLADHQTDAIDPERSLGLISLEVGCALISARRPVARC
jgi:hypothetical protein